MIGQCNMDCFRDTGSVSTCGHFPAPEINITFEEDKLQSHGTILPLLLEISCSVQVADGKPNITFSFFGKEHEKFEVKSSKEFIECHGYFCDGVYSAILSLPHSGWVACTVDDVTGTYSINTTIAMAGKILYKASIHKTFLYVAVLFTVHCTCHIVGGDWHSYCSIFCIQLIYRQNYSF